MSQQSLLKKSLAHPSQAIRVLTGLGFGLVIKWHYRVTNPRVQIGSDFRAYCWLHVRGPGIVRIGRSVSVGRGFQRRPAIVTHTRRSQVHIGDRSYLSGARISCADRVEIGPDALFGSATIIDTDVIPPGGFELDAEWIGQQARSISIGRSCWLGANSFVLRGSELGDEVVVAAGAVVREAYVERGALLLGNPARKMGMTRS